MYHLGDEQRDIALFPHFHTFWAQRGEACSLANEVLTNWGMFLLLPFNTNSLANEVLTNWEMFLLLPFNTNTFLS